MGYFHFGWLNPNEVFLQWTTWSFKAQFYWGYLTVGWQLSACGAAFCKHLQTPIFHHFRIINGLTPWCRRPPFQGGAAGKGQNGPHAHQSCKYCRVFESLGSVNIDCGTMNAMYWYQGYPWLFMECCFHILGMVCLASLAWDVVFARKRRTKSMHENNIQ